MFSAHKKIDRLLTRGKEMVGQEAKTSSTDDFKAMESEMNLRHEGMDKINKSMNNYVKTLSQRTATETRDKMLPGAYLGSTMLVHGQDFAPDSEFGACLSQLGRANEALARKQESYSVAATSTWLESLERSLVQMKEYQLARKKLEQRRVAYDTSLSKMQKQKREDFKMEEELRSQKAKYEEASEDVFRRMEEIRQAETESVTDLTSFLDAQLQYYDSCAQILVQLKRDWPVQRPDTASRLNRSRTNTAHSYSDRFAAMQLEEEEPEPLPPRPTIARVHQPSSASSSPPRVSPQDYARPSLYRAKTTDTQQDLPRDYSPITMPRVTRVPTDPSSVLARVGSLRPVPRQFDDSASDRYYDRNDSPVGFASSRTASWGSDGPQQAYQGAIGSTGGITSAGGGIAGVKKIPPPPPPSRGKKPPPPPPPMKRSAMSMTQIPQSPL